jgi:hypothetical protein
MLTKEGKIISGGNIMLKFPPGNFKGALKTGKSNSILIW